MKPQTYHTFDSTDTKGIQIPTGAAGIIVEESEQKEVPCMMEQAAKEHRQIHGPNVPVVLHLVCPCPKCRVTC